MATASPSSPPAPAPRRKPRNAYHHGDLRRALLDQAVTTIRDRGVDALTLRDVGARLRVSRTALYRHFADKEALLAAVAAEGFRTFRDALVAAWDDGGHTMEGLGAMGRAYVTFARTNPSHYRVMFGGFVGKTDCDPDLREAASAAFAVLAGAVAQLQQTGAIGPGAPDEIAVFIWASVHGLAMLAIDGQLTRPGVSIDALTDATVARVLDAVGRRR